MPAFHDLSAFQLHLVFEIVAGFGASGQELKRPLETLYGEEVLHGRLYRNLSDS